MTRPVIVLMATAALAGACCDAAWVVPGEYRIEAVADYARHEPAGADVVGAGVTSYFRPVWDDEGPHALLPFLQRASFVSIRAGEAWQPSGSETRADVASDVVLARESRCAFLIRQELALYSGLSPYRMDLGLRALGGLEVGVNVIEGSFDSDVAPLALTSDRPFVRCALPFGSRAFDLGLEAHLDSAERGWTWGAAYYPGKAVGVGLVAVYLEDAGGDIEEHSYEARVSWDAPRFGVGLRYESYVEDDYRSFSVALSRRY